MKSEFTEVYVTYDEVEAGMLVDLLRSGGIEAHMRSSKVTPYPVNVGRMGEIKIIVNNADADEANKLIATECPPVTDEDMEHMDDATDDGPEEGSSGGDGEAGG